MNKVSPQKNRIGLALALAVLSAGFLFSATAQEGAPALSLIVIPPMVFAGDQITVTAIPENFSATSTTFEWYRNGVLVPGTSGIGRTALVLSTNEEGPESILVRVIARPPGLSPIDRTTVIQTLPGGPAQIQKTIEDLTSNFVLKASDENPDPGEAVTVSVSAFTFDTSAASYQWYVNGVWQKDASGRGKTSISLPGMKGGETKTVRVDATVPDGQVRSESVTIRPASATTYWWAESAVPYWYKGKALPAVGSRVTVLAIPNVANPSSLNYRWEFNAGLMPQASGVGKSAFSFVMTLPVEERIGVVMRDQAGSFGKSVDIGVRPATPEVSLYELRPLRGVVFETALREFSAPSGEPYDFIAAPFFLAGEARNLRYTWTLNGNDITGEFATPWLFTLSSNPNAPASGLLSVRAEDIAKSPNRAQASVNVQLR